MPRLFDEQTKKRNASVGNHLHDHYVRGAEARQLQAEAIAMGLRWLSGHLRNFFTRIIGRGRRGAVPMGAKRRVGAAGASRDDRLGVKGFIRCFVLEPQARRRRRREAIAQLRSLDDRLLADIGVTRGQIELAVDGKLSRAPYSSRERASRPEPLSEDLPLAA